MKDREKRDESKVDSRAFYTKLIFAIAKCMDCHALPYGKSRNDRESFTARNDDNKEALRLESTFSRIRFLWKAWVALLSRNDSWVCHREPLR
ncbi:hypothetical protein [Helicobacter canis]|uniref:hypothetical protein n=1 Tax=Helicobacter canis TaxID=29419 RepID=UPI0011C03ECD|nr:hypothetical protein [Helicobacter canis]